jgi:hypothetical protein
MNEGKLGEQVTAGKADESTAAGGDAFHHLLNKAAFPEPLVANAYCRRSERN